LNKEVCINNLFGSFFHYLVSILPKNKNNIILLHNLGGFDGYFIYKYLLSNYSDQLSTLIDTSNKIIIIQVKIEDVTIVFKDSLRIFPTSLNGLCEVFDVKGKLSVYDPTFNHINILTHV
jgi:hypothetical protein